MVRSCLESFEDWKKRTKPRKGGVVRIRGLSAKEERAINRNWCVGIEFIRNMRTVETTVWRICHLDQYHNNVCLIPLIEYKEAKPHPCPYPKELVNRALLMCSDEGDVICDPFGGSGTTAIACKENNRQYILFEISPEYCKIAEKRLEQKNLWEVLE